MKEKDYEYIATVERAIEEKYGEEAIQHPRANWSEDKEKQYLEQIKDLQQKQCYIQWVEGREDRWKTGWRPE